MGVPPAVEVGAVPVEPEVGFWTMTPDSSPANLRVPPLVVAGAAPAVKPLAPPPVMAKS
jgi:hypothetical protein